MKPMSVENAKSKLLHWWTERLGNGSAGYLGKEPTAAEIVDSFLKKYHDLKEHRKALLELAESKGSHMFQLWPGWEGGPAPRRSL